MSEAGDGQRTPERKRDQFGRFVQKSYNKTELALKHAVGLGAVQNVVPISHPTTNGPPRPVSVGWHPVGGFAGKWFAENTGLGKMITEKINKYPDPTQHWAVLVGEYAHQLWMDENFDVIYTNARVDPKEWQTFRVGETTFNDDAIRRAGEAVINNIRATRPGYNLISNNCQTYALELLDVLQVSQHKEFGTTLAVYDRLFSSGKVADLFPENETPAQAPEPAGQAVFSPPTGGQELGVIGGTSGQDPSQSMMHQGYVNNSGAPQTSVSLAQQVMHDNTTQLNPEDQMQRSMDEHGKKEGWSEKTTSFFRKFKK